MKHRSNYTRYRKPIHGFTLVELLVVISIIALLLSILMPSLSRAREQARQVVCSSNLKQVAISMVMYTDSNDDHMPENQVAEYDLCRGEQAHLDIDEVWVGIGRLYYSGNLEDTEVLYCPSEKYDKYGKDLSNIYPWNSATYETKTIFMPPSERPDYRILMAYQYRFSYWCWGKGDTKRDFRGKQGEIKFSILNKSGIIGDKASYNSTIHFGHRNYAYGDAHVEKVQTSEMTTGMNIFSGKWWVNYVDLATCK